MAQTFFGVLYMYVSIGTPPENLCKKTNNIKFDRAEFSGQWILYVWPIAILILMMVRLIVFHRQLSFVSWFIASPHLLLCRISEAGFSGQRLLVRPGSGHWPAEGNRYNLSSWTPSNMYSWTTFILSSWTPSSLSSWTPSSLSSFKVICSEKIAAIGSQNITLV